MLALRAAPVLMAVAALASGCGDGEDLLSESSLRECLASEGLTVEAPDLVASPALGNVSPDFRAVTEEGAGVDVVVQASEEKARRSAADIQGALRSLGAGGSEVVSNRNAIAVFEEPPVASSRQAVERCLEG